MTSATSHSSNFALPPLPELRTVKVFGQRICYYDVGAGPPLVLVHGLGADADVWAFCLDALSASHRVLALDLLGFGRSDKPLIDYQVAVFVEVLEGFLKALSIERASLLGNSLGGCIVASFALAFPTAVDKLILNDAVGIRAGAIEFPVDLNVSTRAHMREVLEFMFHDKRLVTDGLVDLTYQLHLERNDGYTIRSVLGSNRDGRDFLDDRLKQLKVPTLVLWGENDAVAPLAMARNFHRLIAASRLEIIHECGHIPALEKPGELVQRALAFLQENLHQR